MTNTVGRRLPSVEREVVASFIAPQVPIDPCPAPTETIDVDDALPEDPMAQAVAPPEAGVPPTETTAHESASAAGSLKSTPVDDGTVHNPYYKTGPASTDVTMDGEQLEDMEPECEAEAVVESPPATTTSITDAVIPGHLQQSWFQIIRGGYALANRGALFAARQEFEKALYEIAQTKDLLSEGGHTAALLRALRAMREAIDFLPGDGSLTATVQTKILLDGHQTPIARELPTSLPATALFEAYHRYAEEQMAFAVGGTRAGSVALHALGKLHDRLAAVERDRCRDAADLAVTYQRSAIHAHGGNYLAANELGVLLARGGDYARARQMFVRSLQLAPSREAQYNLQVTDARLAEMQGRPVAPPARMVASQAPRRPQVHWVSVDQFVASSPTPRAPVAQNGSHPAPRSAGQVFPVSRFRR